VVKEETRKEKSRREETQSQNAKNAESNSNAEPPHVRKEDQRGNMFNSTYSQITPKSGGDG